VSGHEDVVEVARRILAARRRRQRYLPAELLGEPAWDLLLDLLVSQSEGREVPLKDACIASGVPATTAMRCLEGLRSKGLVDHTPDPVDRRRKLLVLTPSGEERIRRAVLDCLPQTSEAGGRGVPKAKAA
jgi:DNA-binding MarR family transcriptional regulator